MKVVTKGWGPKSTLSNIPSYFERRKMEHRTLPKKKKRERKKEREKERKKETKKLSSFPPTTDSVYPAT